MKCSTIATTTPAPASRTPRLAARDVKEKRGEQMHALELAIAAGNIDAVAAAIADLTGCTLSVSLVRRKLAQIPELQRGAILRRFCSAVARAIDDQEAAIAKLLGMPAPQRSAKNEKNRSPKTVMNGDPVRGKDAG